MHTGRRSGLAAAGLGAAVLLAAPAAAAPAPWSAPAAPPVSAAASSRAAADAEPKTGAAADLPRLQGALAAVTSRAQQLADSLEQAAARTAGTRQSADDLDRQQAGAQARLDERVRQVYIAGTADRPPNRNVAGPDDPAFSAPGDAARRSWTGLAAAWGGLADPGGEVFAARGQRAALRVDADLVQAVTEHKAQAAELSAQAQQAQTALREQATAVLLAQDQARQLLADAEQVAAQQAATEQAAAERAAAQTVADLTAADLAAADLAAARQAAQQRAAEQATVAARDQLAAVRGTLDAVSASVTRSLSPAGRPLTVRQAPLLAALVAAGSGYPAGYRPTGQVLTGTASWYGPGFVGNPTASGAAYDPEQLSCANKDLPLGTVLHVTANGRQVNCLVNDRGPYVGDRILDMSRAGSRALGYDGVTLVVIQVLAAV